jgi:hypothetical protein
VDPEKFDDLIARLASAASRRDAVKGVISGALASVGASSLTSAKRDRGKKRKKDNDKKKDEDNRNRSGRKAQRKNKSAKKTNTKTKKNDKESSAKAESRRSDVSMEKKGANGRCRKNPQCLSKNCRGANPKKGKKGRCAASKPGQPCFTTTDCATGAQCVSGTCGFVS